MTMASVCENSEFSFLVRHVHGDHHRNFSFRVWRALGTAKVESEQQSYLWEVRKTGLQQAREASGKSENFLMYMCHLVETSFAQSTFRHKESSLVIKRKKSVCVWGRRLGKGQKK